MFSITPYSARREVFTTDAEGMIRSTWEPCRVIGIAVGEDDPEFIVEYFLRGETFLAREPSVRREP